MLSVGTLRQRKKHSDLSGVARDVACTPGVEFTLLTDHKPLEVIYSTNSRNSARIERWLLRLLLKALKIAQAEKKNSKVDWMRKFVTAYRTTPHSSTGVSPAKLLFNREKRPKIPELTKCEYIDSEARDRDADMKQRRTYYADERRRAQENSLAPGDQVLVKQRKENKLSTTFEDAPYNVTNKYGNEVTVTSTEGVNYKRNVTEVKNYLKAGDGPDQQSTGDSVTGGAAESEVPELPLRPTRERRVPEYLNDYELC